jgi:cell division protein FtsQ
MTATPTPTSTRIDPRLRQRRIEVQRELGRRRLRVLIAITAVVGSLGIVFLAIHSPFLDVDAVRVTGANHVTAAQVEAAAGVHHHDPLLLVNTGAVARRVEALAWVAHASVTRDLPGTLRIAITEYVPAAYVHTGNQFVLLAPDGRAVAVANSAPAGAVEVRGVRRAPAVGEMLSPPEAAGIVKQLPPALASQVRAVDVGSDDISLDLARGGAVRLGPPTDLAAKGAATLSVLASYGSGCFSYIDVGAPSTPVLHKC